jgi:hypothetical protein
MINADKYLHTHLSNKGFLDDICTKLSELVQKISNHFETIKIQGQIRDVQKSIDEDQREIECLNKKISEVPDNPYAQIEGKNYDALSMADRDVQDRSCLEQIRGVYQAKMLESKLKIKSLIEKLIKIDPKYSSEIQSTIEQS